MEKAKVQNDNKLYIYTGAGENTNYQPDATKLVNTWHLVAATFGGGTQGSRKLYWDGVLVGSFSGAVNSASKTSAFTIGYFATICYPLHGPVQIQVKTGGNAQAVRVCTALSGEGAAARW